MSLSTIFSLVYFIVFAISVLLGVYILSLNTKSRLNRVFFAFCIALCIWAFSFSISNSAPDYETTLFWRRLASLGWGTILGFQLHFFLILTERSSVLKKRWFYMLLYLPSAVTVFVFGIDSNLARGQYNLVNTAVGWVNVYASNWWNSYYGLYYAGFSMAGLWLLWHWGRRSKDPEKKKLAYLLIATFSMTVLLGTMTEIIVNKYMSFNIPQIAPVIVLLPLTVIISAIKRYGLMGPEKIKATEPGEILSEGDLTTFYQVMSMAFMLGGMLSFASQYFFSQASLNSVLLFSSCLFIYGAFLKIITKLPAKADLRDNVFILLVLAPIPLITLRFIASASITVWAIPFIFVILSVVYNKRRMIFGLGIFILLTQIWVWIKVPTAMVQVDGSDYIGRIGIFSIALWLAFYVNRVYIQRLEENEAQIRFQKMVSQISAGFVNFAESNMEEKINWMLRLSGEYFQVDRTYFISLSKHLKTHEWCNDGIEPAINFVPELTDEAYPWWVNQMQNNDMVYIMDVEKLPPEAGEEKAKLKRHNIQSLLSIPVSNKDKILGYLFFASVKEAKIWREDHQDLLRILANLLTDALIKVEAEIEISRLAYYDSLTGLPNRSLFKNRLEQAIHLARRNEKLIGVLFIDLDSFKAVNDTMGHDGGDEILKQVASRLSGCLRKQDTVTRYGGDEFLIQLTQINQTEDLLKIVENIVNTFVQPLTVNKQEIFITASVGIAVYPTDGEEAEALIKNADLAMYASKDRGKDQYTLCSPVLKDDVLKIMKLTNSLYRALERKELVLDYQPQVSIATKEIIGLEALIRWNHPDLGLISPKTFIPLAEKTGLINPIGQWVLQTACRQNKAWQVLGIPPIRMAVNLSVEQFRNPNLVSLVARTLSETGLEARYLELEITERVAVMEADYIIQVLYELKELGVTIAIDGFGTEFSSLSRLKTLPVDRIKIDMQLVHGISEGNKDKAIAKTIIQLAENLKLTVIAEGVETEPQFEFFSKQRCDEIQGFKLYKPMPAVEIEAILFNQFDNNCLPASLQLEIVANLRQESIEIH